MKRSRLSRGLQVLYLEVIVGLILAAVSGAITAVTRTEATGAMRNAAELLPNLVSVAFTCAGLVLLWQVHRGYRYALAAKLVEYALSLAMMLPQLSGISTALGLVAFIPGVVYMWLFIRTTNEFLRQRWEDPVVRRGKTALILYVVASVLLALIMLFVDPSNIQMVMTAMGTTMIATVIASVSGIMLLIYMIQASGVLKDWPPEEEILPPEAPAQSE